MQSTHHRLGGEGDAQLAQLVLEERQVVVLVYGDLRPQRLPSDVHTMSAHTYDAAHGPQPGLRESPWSASSMRDGAGMTW